MTICIWNMYMKFKVIEPNDMNKWGEKLEHNTILLY